VQQTSAYHPEGNGQVERFNRTLEAMLSEEIEEHQKDWDDPAESLFIELLSMIQLGTPHISSYLVVLLTCQ
jgi:hypothetical protein